MDCTVAGLTPQEFGLTLLAIIGLLGILGWGIWLFNIFRTKEFVWDMKDKVKQGKLNDCYEPNWLVKVSPMLVLALAIILFLAFTGVIQIGG